MSDFDWDGGSDEEDEEVHLDTEEGRDAAIEWLLEQNEPDDWAQVQTLQEGDNIVARFRWADGSEEVYDMKIVRSMQIIRRGPAGESN